MLDVLCVVDGPQRLLLEDTGIDNNVRVAVGDVELCCLDVLLGCLGCIYKPDKGYITDGLVALCLDVLIGCLLCIQVDDGDRITDGLVALCCLDVVVVDVD